MVKSLVQRYKVVVLEASGLSPATINQRMSAIRKLASEAADNWLMSQEIANGIDKIKGVRSDGRRTGNWLDRGLAQELINAPDASTLKGGQLISPLAGLTILTMHPLLLRWSRRGEM